MRQIYCDNGSTSFPKAPGLGEAIGKHLDCAGYNINRGGYNSAYSVAETVLDTRERLCRLFGGEQSRNVIFTAGITMSINMILKGLLKSGDHVLVSSMEHNGVVRPLVQLEEEGICWEAVKCGGMGELDPADVERAIRPETRMVLMLHGSNVCGTLLPIAQVGQICRKHNLIFVVDTAQTAGTYPVNMKECGIDILAFAGHKGLLGPQGIGGFLVSAELAADMRPLLAGGTGSTSDKLTMPEFLPDKFEAGTINLPGIVGLNHALRFIESEGMDAMREKKARLTNLFLQEIAEVKGVRVAGVPFGLPGGSGENGPQRTAVVSLDFQTLDNAEASFALEQEYGIMTRCGLHCAPLAHRTLGTFPQGTVRFSFGYFNTEDEIREAAAAVRSICGR